MLGSTTTAATQGQKQFLQQRVARFGLVVGGLFALFLGFRGVFRLTSATPWAFGMSYALHLAASLAFLGAWVACRGAPRSFLSIRAAETASLLLATLALSAMSLWLPLAESPNFILNATLSLALMGRAIYVPSSFRRSLLLAAAVGAIAAVFVYIDYSRIDRSKWVLLYPDIMQTSAPQIALSQTIYFCAWWVVPGLLSAAASRVIYGLRREIRNARQLGQYHLERKLGEGGMGSVYVARHALLRRPTAIKLIKATGASEESRERFEREVQLCASLSHPNTISIFDYGRTPDGIFYYAMELIHGASLAEIVARTGAQPAARVVHLLRQTALALVEAHEMGLVHRDLKPANLMLHGGAGVQDLLKVVDFGLVKEFKAEDGNLTRAGAITGTPHYMSPESIAAPNTVGPPSDLYSLGAVGYFLLTGREPFVGTSIIEICSQHLHADPEPPAAVVGRDIHAGLEALVLRCLAKKPEARPASAAQLVLELDRLDIEPWTRSDAEAWWRKHDDVLSAPPLSLPSESVLTVEMAERGARLSVSKTVVAPFEQGHRPPGAST